MTVDSEIAPKLLQVLRAAAAAPGLAYADPPRPLHGGFWAELFTFSLLDPPPGWPAELVARIMPDAEVAGKETVVQATVASAGFPTPMVRISGRECGLGQAFMVMDKAPGAPLISGLTGAGSIASVLPALRKIPELLAASMAGLHTLDPQLVRSQLSTFRDVAVTLPGLLAALYAAACDYGRSDLAAAARWLIDHPLPSAPEVICHGDLHPFNLLVDGTDLCVLDWSTALLAPRAYDVAFTSLLLEVPPLAVPRALRPGLRRLGARLARQFVARYEEDAGVTVAMADLRWHQGVVCLRALVEVAAWAQQDLTDSRAGHPWLLCESAFAERLRALTTSATE